MISNILILGTIFGGVLSSKVTMYSPIQSDLSTQNTGGIRISVKDELILSCKVETGEPIAFMFKNNKTERYIFREKSPETRFNTIDNYYSTSSVQYIYLKITNNRYLLIIRFTNVFDTSGTYSCMDYQNSTVRSVNVEIYNVFQEILLNPPEDSIVNKTIGSNFSISVFCNDAIGQDLYIAKNDVSIVVIDTESKRRFFSGYKLVIKNDEFILHITDLNVEDSGIYSFSINSYSFKSISLNVIENPEILASLTENYTSSTVPNTDISTETPLSKANLNTDNKLFFILFIISIATILIITIILLIVIKKYKTLQKQIKSNNKPLL